MADEGVTSCIARAVRQPYARNTPPHCRQILSKKNA
jgi:hypothetical protein